MSKYYTIITKIQLLLRGNIVNGGEFKGEKINETRRFYHISQGIDSPKPG